MPSFSHPGQVASHQLACRRFQERLKSLLEKQEPATAYGQVKVAVAVMAVDMAPGLEVEFVDAWAATVTVPVCMHCAMPFWLMVAMFISETLQPPENGAIKVTCAGEGGLLKVPMAVNCTWPIAKFIPLAAAGARVMDISMRSWFIIMLLLAPHPASASRNNVSKGLKRKSVLSFAIGSSGISGTP
jgi:hypothetical protein